MGAERRARRRWQRLSGPGYRLKVALAVLALLATAQADETSVLVDKWVAAQNQGHFADYQRLYATAFTGVRRSGARRVALSRAAWMRERERMFKRPMTVEAVVEDVVKGGDEDTVELMQKWQSGGYSDTGHKRLTLTRQDGTLQILYEEMLESTRDQVIAPDLDAFAWVVTGHRLLVLSRHPDEKWAVGPAVSWRGQTLEVAARAVDRAPPFARWMGRAVTVTDDKGHVCATKIDGLYVAGIEWNADAPRDAGTLWEDTRKGVMSPPTELGHVLVGRYEGCENGVWARAADLPATVAMAEPGKAKAVAALRALPRFRELDATVGKRWDRIETRSYPGLRRVAAFAERGTECTDGVSIGVMWTVGANGALSDPVDIGVLPDAILKLDGAVEILTPTYRLRPGKPTDYRPLPFICDC